MNLEEALKQGIKEAILKMGDTRKETKTLHLDANLYPEISAKVKELDKKHEAIKEKAEPLLNSLSYHEMESKKLRQLLNKLAEEKVEAGSKFWSEVEIMLDKIKPEHAPHNDLTLSVNSEVGHIFVVTKE